MERSYRDLLLCYMQRQYINNFSIESIGPENKAWFLLKDQIYLGLEIFNELQKAEVCKQVDLINEFYKIANNFIAFCAPNLKKGIILTICY